MARKKRSELPKDPEGRWAAAKRRCRLSGEDLRKAKALGLSPEALVKNIPSPSQSWKAPVNLWVRELYERRFPGRTPLDEQIAEQDGYARRRRRDFRDAARAVARELGLLPQVERVLLFGSVSRPLEREAPRARHLRGGGATVLHECKDVDLAVFVTDTSALRDLQLARATALQRLHKQKKIGVAHHQIDVFLLDAVTGHYAGRLCTFRECPADKPECQVPGCGASPYLRQHEDFAFDPAQALEEAKQLYPRAQSPPSDAPEA